MSYEGEILETNTMCLSCKTPTDTYRVLDSDLTRCSDCSSLKELQTPSRIESGLRWLILGFVCVVSMIVGVVWMVLKLVDWIVGMIQ